MKTKHYIICLMIVLSLLSQSQTIQASEPYINGTQVQIYDIKNEKSYYTYHDISDIQKGQRIQMIFTFESSVNKEIILKIPALSSFDQLSILSWNGKQQTQTKTTDETVEIATHLLKQKNVLVVEGTYQGALKGKANVQVSIEFADGLSYTKGFEFLCSQEGFSNENETKIEARFIEPHGKLISLQTLSRGQSAILPQYQPIGYTVEGYMKEDTDVYYQGEALQKSTNFKAVVKPIAYTIHYYIDDKIYHTREAYYGTTVEWIQAPKKEGYQFVKWIGLINNIYKDLDVYALYQDDQGAYIIEDEKVKEEEFITTLQRKQTEKIKKSGDKKDDSQYSLFELDQNKVFEAQEQTSFLESPMSHIFHQLYV